MTDPAQVDVDVVVVGAGHAGTQLATSLASDGDGLSVALVGDEPDLPYDRPTLSKAYLLGDVGLDGILLRTAEFWTSSGVQTFFGRRVVHVDADRHVVTCDDATKITYGSLVWAAGGRARPLPESMGSADYLTLRSLDDVHRLRPALDAATHVTVIGGGYIGLEAAAVIRASDVAVTLIETAPRLLARVTGPHVSDFIAQEHRAAGVDIRLGRSVLRLVDQDGGTIVVLDDGTELLTDLVIAGIGMLPNTEVLAAAGAEIDNGIVVDELCRTRLPDVFAIGDCASHVNRFAGGILTRLECVQNAVEQAKVVHRVLTGQPSHYDAVPWFWSNQYDIKLKSAGLVHGADRAILRGDPAERAFSVVYLRDDLVVAVDAVNVPRDFMRARQLIQSGARVDADAVADPATDLRDAVLADAVLTER